MKILPFPAALLALVLPPPATAQTAVAVRIGVEEGAIYDGILDGFPGIAVLDGIGDLPGNQLGVALRSRVTEERGVAEFPLESIPAGGTLAEATLRFNIDDVLSTFGPGTDFSGRAAATIFVHVYTGDGELALADFGEIGGPAHAVDTTVYGTIDDARISRTGPLLFDVDLTDDVAAVVAAGASHLGIVWRTEDSPTGTSLDDLGADSAGPPGVSGAALPFVTLRFAAALQPTVSPTASPVASETRTPSLPTATPGTAARCSGDCSHDDSVTVDEIVTLVSVALGNQAPGDCPAGDANRDGQVTVDEVVTAIGMALAGCPQASF